MASIASATHVLRSTSAGMCCLVQNEDCYVAACQCLSTEVTAEPRVISTLNNVQIGEMEAAIDFLKQQEQETYGVLGHSKGGTEVILFGAKHDSDTLR